MATVKFKKDSIPYTIHVYLSAGNSLTHDEAYDNLKVRYLSQRIADLKIKFEEAGVTGHILVLDEANARGNTHARYFYKDCGCEHEGKFGVRVY